MDLVNKRILQFFSSLADETRLKILISLIKGAKNVGEIYKAVGKNRITLSAVSHQLRLMENQEIIDSQKNGREKFFQLSDNFCWCILKDALSHFNGEKTQCKKCISIMEDWSRK